MKYWKVKLKGKFYYICSGNKKDGAIATKRQYENGYESFAYMEEGGNIMRYGEIIANRKNLVYLGKFELHPKIITAMYNILCGNGWSF